MDLKKIWNSKVWLLNNKVVVFSIIFLLLATSIAITFFLNKGNLKIAKASGISYTVINTNDSGIGSLRQAIVDANTNPGEDEITFNIPGTGTQTIILDSSLPDITEDVSILGETQPGTTSSPTIEITGNNLLNPVVDPTLMVLADNVTISTLSLYSPILASPLRNDYTGLSSRPAIIALDVSNTTVRNNYINLTADGLAVDSRHQSANGVVFLGVVNGTITGNVLSNRAANGLTSTDMPLITLASYFINNFGSPSTPENYTSNRRSENIIVTNNKVGVNPAGTADSGGYTSVGAVNSGSVDLKGAKNITIDNNVISGNYIYAISASRAIVNSVNYQVEDLTINNNKIGTDINGNYIIGDGFSNFESIDGGLKSFVFSNNIISARGGAIYLRTGVAADPIVGTISNNKFNVNSSGTGMIFSGYAPLNSHGGVSISAETSDLTITGNSFGGASSNIDLNGTNIKNVKIRQNIFNSFSDTGYSDAINLVGVTLNDNGDIDLTPSNEGLNRPVVTKAAISGTDLIVEGFTRPNTELEFFKDTVASYASGNTYNQGRGNVYLGTKTESSAEDLDSATGTYTDGQNGTDTTNKFKFVIPVSSLSAPLAAGDFLTLTATSDNSINGGIGTSEFSTRFAVTSIPSITNSNISSATCSPNVTTINTSLNCTITTNVNFNTLSGSLNLKVGSSGAVVNCPIPVSGNKLTCLNIPVGSISGNFSALYNASGSGSTYSLGSNITVADLTLNPNSGTIAGGTLVNISGAGFGSFEGTRDISFGTGVGPNGTPYATVVQNDGKILIGGSFSKYDNVSRNNIARLNSDGSLDTSFNVGTGADNLIRTIAVQNDGKIIVGGYFTSYNATPINRIARLNTDGSLDSSFNIGTGADNGVEDIILLAGGDMLVSGTFNSFNSTLTNQIVKLNTNGGIIDPNFSVNLPTGGISTTTEQADSKIIISKGSNILRVNPDGSIDNTFTPGIVGGGCCGHDVSKILVDSTGKIVITGYFVTYNGVSKIDIVRLNPDGSIDNSYAATGGYITIFDSIIQPDDKVIVGGNFNSFNGINGKNRIVRLNVDGSIDTSFNVGTGTEISVFALALQANGEVIVGGAFSTFNGLAVNTLIRLYGGFGISATFDGLPATSLTLVNSNLITAITPAHVSGPVDFVLTNGNGTVATLLNGYTYIPPSIQNSDISSMVCSPSTAEINTTLDCVITTNADLATLSGNINVRIGTSGATVNCPIIGSGNTLDCNGIDVGGTIGTFPSQYNASGSSSNYVDGNDILVTNNLTTLEITTLNAIICNSGNSVTVNSTTTCTFTLPVNKTLPSDFKLGIGDATPAGTCSVTNVSTGEVTCTSVPTGTLTGTQPINGQIGIDTVTPTQSTLLVVSTIQNTDISTLVCTPTIADISTTVNCEVTLVSGKDLANLIGTIKLKISDGAEITCPVLNTSGLVLNCGNVEVGTLIGTYKPEFSASGTSPVDTFSSLGSNDIVVINPLVSSDIPTLAITCIPNPVITNAFTNCTFDLPNNKTYPSDANLQIKLGIGDAIPTALCLQLDLNSTLITCDNTPTGTLTGTQPVLGIIGTQSVSNNPANTLSPVTIAGQCTTFSPCALFETALNYNPTQANAKRYGASGSTNSADLILTLKDTRLEQSGFTTTCSVKYKFRTDTNYRVLTTNSAYNNSTGCTANLLKLDQLLFNVDFEITAVTTNSTTNTTKNYLLYSNYDFKAGSIGVTSIGGTGL